MMVNLKKTLILISSVSGARLLNKCKFIGPSVGKANKIWGPEFGSPAKRAGHEQRIDGIFGRTLRWYAALLRF